MIQTSKFMASLRSILLIAYCCFFFVGQPSAFGQTPLATDQQYTFSSLSDFQGFSLAPIANRSYCCEVWAQNASVTFGTFNNWFKSGAQIRFAEQSVVDRGDYLPVQYGGSRVCWTQDVYAQFGNLQFGVTFDIAGDDTSANNVTIRCDETTLYCGFNTSVSDFNFLELTNMNKARSAVEEDWDLIVDVAAADQVNNVNVAINAPDTIGAGKRVDLDIHSASGPGVFGTIEITHDGPLGILQAIVSQYKASALGLPDFSPVAREICRPRKAMR